MIGLTEKHIEVFCAKLIEILEKKYNVKIDYVLKDKKEN